MYPVRVAADVAVASHAACVVLCVGVFISHGGRNLGKLVEIGHDIV